MNRLLDAIGRLFSPEQKSTGHKVTRNVIFSGLRGLLVWPIPFLIIPFILEKVGPEGYGICAVFLTIIKLTAISDFGMGGTLTKYVAEYYTGTEFRALDDLINTALMLYGVIALLIPLVLSLESERFLPMLFHGSGGEISNVQILWKYMLVILMLNVLVMPFYSILTGLQRMDLTNLLSSFNTTCAAALVAIFLELGWALPGILLAYLITAALMLVTYAGVVRRLLPVLRLNPLQFKREQVGRILSFSVQIYVVGISATVSNEIEKLYLAWFAGVVPVGWYDMASQAALRIRRIPELILGPFMAAASELDARGEHEKLQELYYRAHKYISLVSLPLLFYLVIVAGRLVNLWLGSRLHFVAMPLCVLTTANLISLVTGPGALTLVGKGILKPVIHSSLLAVLLNLVLSYWLIHSYGFSGAIFGTIFAIAGGTIYFLVAFRRRLGRFSKRSTARAYVKPLIAAGVPGALLALMNPFSHTGWTGIAIEGLIFGGAYLTALTVLGFFDSFDLDRIERFLPAARRVRRFITVA